MIDGETKIQDLEERRQVLLEELSWFALTQDGIFDEYIHRDLLSEADRQIVDETSRVNEARELTKEFNSGPCFSSIDSTLNYIV